MSAPAARIAEIVAEGRRLERPNEPGPKGQRAVFWAEHASLFLAVAEKTLALFVALDRERPGWREETCVISGDEVNRAWYELEKSLGLGPDAVRGEEKK